MSAVDWSLVIVAALALGWLALVICWLVPKPPGEPASPLRVELADGTVIQASDVDEIGALFEVIEEYEQREHDRFWAGASKP